MQHHRTLEQNQSAWILRRNIERYRHLLTTALDESMRKVLLELSARAGEELAVIGNSELEHRQGRAFAARAMPGIRQCCSAGLEGDRDEAEPKGQPKGISLDSRGNLADQE
jgi:hypothetical protein